MQTTTQTTPIPPPRHLLLLGRACWTTAFAAFVCKWCRKSRYASELHYFLFLSCRFPNTMVRFKVRIDSFTLFTLYLFYISSVPMALAVSSCLNVAHPAAFVECFRVLWCSGQVRMTHVGGITLCNFQYRQKYEIYMLGSLSVVQ